MLFKEKDYFILNKRFTYESKNNIITFDKGQYGRIEMVLDDGYLLMVSIFISEEDFENHINKVSGIEISSHLVYIPKSFAIKNFIKINPEAKSSNNKSNDFNDICIKETYGPLILYRTKNIREEDILYNE